MKIIFLIDFSNINNDIKKQKFICNDENRTIGDIISKLVNRMSDYIDKNETYTLMIKNIILKHSDKLLDIYKKHGNEINLLLFTLLKMKSLG